MVRVLLVQQLFNLSDEPMECLLLDRLSFQRFVGLRTSSQILDRTTILTFKERLIAASASETIFEAANRQLAQHGFLFQAHRLLRDLHDAGIYHLTTMSRALGPS